MKKLNKKSIFDEIAQSEYSIFCDDFDVNDYNDVKQNSHPLLDLENTGKKEYKPFLKLTQDIYSSVARLRPHLLDDWQIAGESLLNKEFMNQIQALSKHKEVRVFTVGDKVLSTIATEALAEKALEIIKELKKQKEELQKLLDAQQQQAEEEQKLQDMIDAMDGKEDKDSKNTGSAIAKQKTTLEEAKKKVEEFHQTFKESMREQKVQGMISSAISKTADFVREESEFLEAWGLGASGSYESKPYHEKMELVKRLRSSSKLKAIAKLAGRFKRMALQQQKEKIKKGIDEIFSIQRGSDLSKLLPSEITKLNDPNRRLEFMVDLVENKCLQYDLRGKAKKSKGAIVCCIDNSGSMSGDPEIWSKAVALALLEVAMSQKRNFFVIHFSSGYGSQNLKVHEFLKNKPPSIEEILAMAEYFEGGGTEFEPPLNKAKDVIDTETNYSKADIVFITDGEAAVRDSWLVKYKEWKKSNKVSIYSVLIEGGWSFFSKTLDEFSDQILKLSDIRGDQQDTIALGIFDSI